MARSVSKAKLFPAFVVDGISNAIYGRGYATIVASQGVVLSSSVTRGNRSAPGMARTAEKVAWVPNLVTGYYRPENLAGELDVVDLRALLLKNKN